MKRILARRALLPTGWAEDVLLTVRDGELVDVTAGVPSPPAADLTAGIVIPGLTNAHSHAFQRALAGRTEHRSDAGRDSFWTWRERMYELTGRLDLGSLTAIARQAYAEMLVAGYTSVAEFHYLFRDPAGRDDADAMFGAVRRAAADAGIRLIYVPVLYERAGFDRPAPEPRQRRFAMDVESFLAHQERAADGASGRVTVGIGGHSLRAVSEESLRRVAARAAASGAPLHIHVAEQRREVEDCLAAYGSRPVRWLLDRFDVGEQWCLVHATHLNEGEMHDLAASGAVVCLCPSTEGNLGDGLFPLERFLPAGGRIAIGSDSQVAINPFEELRWLEYGQRLISETRNVASVEDPHVGRELFRRALAGGAQAAGQSRFGLAPGAPADLVVLDAEDPMLAGHGPATLLDALLFSGYRVPIERVMVHGEWKVTGGRHVDRSRTARDFAAALARLGMESP
ncbi:MAG: formimidoylglutamate deiminase [Acidobacteria bacterium]|nr:formimidoylglutamate deiminase [Acidobacteriota bacterium]MYF13411.1 formimidoylglutamate deiminase [Acidobacteriota bacterium]MYI97840.1 formimidoylglutamate deiminase [Acidobacteriota bacterium]